MSVSDHDRAAYGVMADNIVAGRDQAAALADVHYGWGSQTSFAVDTGLGSYWSRLVTLASDPQAMRLALTHQGWGDYR